MTKKTRRNFSPQEKVAILKQHLVEGLTKKYSIETLALFEIHASMESAIGREKAIRKWRRAWKIKLIEESILVGVIHIPTCCDDVALEKNLCIPGNWPTHSWTVAYAPFENPEIAVVAFVYNGGEGAAVAGPIVRQILEAYFELKTIDTALSGS